MIKKKISLDEAQKKDKMQKFIKQHPSTGDLEMFELLLNAMCNGDLKKRKS
jgi:hypothetical protein